MIAEQIYCEDCGKRPATTCITVAVTENAGVTIVVGSPDTTVPLGANTVIWKRIELCLACLKKLSDGTSKRVQI